MAKVVLDACCGSRMCWYDPENPAAVFMDNRELEALSGMPWVIATVSSGAKGI